MPNFFSSLAVVMETGTTSATSIGLEGGSVGEKKKNEGCLDR